MSQTDTPITDKAVLKEPYEVRCLPFEVVKASDMEALERDNARLRKALEESKSLIQMFGSFLDHWSLKREQKPSDVYAAWDEVRERSGMSEAKATAALAVEVGE